MSSAAGARVADRRPAAASGTFVIGGDLPVHRLGFGAMRVTGPGIWGEHPDRNAAIAVLKTAVDLGITMIDTADSYGPHSSENLIAEALYPYPSDLVIATKAGLLRPGPGKWEPHGHPSHLRSAVEGSLRRLRLDRIDLLQLHRIDPKIPFEDQIGALVAMQREGKIRHIGLSNVSVAEIDAARVTCTIVSVQNRYNLGDREYEDVLEYCTRENIAFIPWFPLATGDLAKHEGPLARIAERLGHARRKSPLRGCWLGRRQCCRFRAPLAWSISSKMSPPRLSISTPPIWRR